MLPVLKGETSQSHDDLFLIYSNLYRCIVKGDYKYIIYNVCGKLTEQLFNLKDDLGELVNLADKNQQKKAEMRNLLAQRMKENHDFCDLDKTLWWQDGYKLIWEELIGLYVFDDKESEGYEK